MINYKLRIDLDGEREIYENIAFTTGDKSGYRFEFLFYSNGKKIDTSLYGLTIKAKRADGAVIIDSGVTTKDEAYYIVADNAYSVKGELEFEVALVKTDGTYATTKVISASVREGFGEVGLSSSDNEPVLAKLEGQYLECLSSHDVMSKEIAENAETIKNNAENFNAHIAGESGKHNAKDITYLGDYYNEEQNIENAINYLGGEIDKHSGSIADNFKFIQKNTTDITAIKTDVEAHTTTINNIIDDLAYRPTSEWVEEVVNDLDSKDIRIQEIERDVVTNTENIQSLINDIATRPTEEWSEEVVNDLSDKEERVSALEKLTSESLPDLDEQIRGNKASIEILSVTVGDIGTALDSIIAIQNELIGGDGV